MSPEDIWRKIGAFIILSLLSQFLSKISDLICLFMFSVTFGQRLGKKGRIVILLFENVFDDFRICILDNLTKRVLSKSCHNHSYFKVVELITSQG